MLLHDHARRAAGEGVARGGEIGRGDRLGDGGEGRGHGEAPRVAAWCRRARRGWRRCRARPPSRRRRAHCGPVHHGDDRRPMPRLRLGDGAGDYALHVRHRQRYPARGRGGFRWALRGRCRCRRGRCFRHHHHRRKRAAGRARATPAEKGGGSSAGPRIAEAAGRGRRGILQGDRHWARARRDRRGRCRLRMACAAHLRHRAGATSEASSVSTAITACALPHNR